MNFHGSFERAPHGGASHYDPNQPRVPADDPSHHGGRWVNVSGSASGGTPSHRKPIKGGTPPYRRPIHRSGRPIAQHVVLPNGWLVGDLKSSTGFLQSPVNDLQPVADAGRRTGEMYRYLLRDPSIAPSALFFLGISLFLDVGTGGKFDYQPSGNQVLGNLPPDQFFTHDRKFRNVSNFNVGVYCQQARLALDDTLRVTGAYARIKSSNADANAPYGLDKLTRQWVEIGFQVAASGAFGPPP